MLWSEPAGSTSNNNVLNPAYSVVQFNETVYSNIRRFVVVSVPNGKGFVYAWYVHNPFQDSGLTSLSGITTYSQRGALKGGCNPKDHAVVYFDGASPYWLEEEVTAGMTNEAIAVERAEDSMHMHWASRINFGKTVAVEKNVKVKDLGRVKPEHMSNLTTFWKVAKGEEDDD